jgi:pimeloyl-ACP methyl ester carboxylesterase
VPTLLLQGSQTWDPMPVTMDALAAALPVAPRRVILAGASHFASHTAPATFTDAVRSFVGDH